MITEQLTRLVEEALKNLRAAGVLPEDAAGSVEFERPARTEHGEFATSIALALSGPAGVPPRELAEKIRDALPAHDVVSKVEVGGPGFLNFHLSHSWLYDVMVEVAQQGEAFGRSTDGSGIRVQVEYGSANPTGPIHVGNARNVAYGDVLANVLQAAGNGVERENYLNDTGGQMERFARSLEARYLQALGREAKLEDDDYLGEYLAEMGAELARNEGMGLIGKLDEILAWGLAKMTEEQVATLERFGVKHDTWFSEKSLHESGKVGEAIERLKALGFTYEQEGALWFKATKFGHSKDRVLIRSVGDKLPTYLAADTAYLIDKLSRGFDRCIYFWGPDHHGTAANLQSVAQALGVDGQVEIIIYQVVNFTKGGEPAPMSKRSGTLITLDELLDEVGVDAARFTFLSRSADSPIDFDFEAVKTESQENPVYYVQYAHARISSIMRYAAESGIELGDIAQAPLSELIHESEHALIRKVAEYPELLRSAAQMRTPHRLTYYARELAELFHGFYRDCRVIGDDQSLTRARLWLTLVARQVLANTLRLLGVSAPEQM